MRRTASFAGRPGPNTSSDHDRDQTTRSSDELEDLGVEIGELGSTFERFADYPDVDEWPAAGRCRCRTRSRCSPRCAVMSHTSRAIMPSLPPDAGNDKLIPRVSSPARGRAPGRF